MCHGVENYFPRRGVRASLMLFFIMELHGPSMMSVTQPAEVFTSAGPVKATGNVTATQPGETPSMMRESAAITPATQPVEDPGTGRLGTQPVEAPSVRTATSPVETSGNRTDMHPGPSPAVELLLIILVCLT